MAGDLTLKPFPISRHSVKPINHLLTLLHDRDQSFFLAEGWFTELLQARSNLAAPHLDTFFKSCGLLALLTHRLDLLNEFALLAEPRTHLARRQRVDAQLLPQV